MSLPSLKSDCIADILRFLSNTDQVNATATCHALLQSEKGLPLHAVRPRSEARAEAVPSVVHALTTIPRLLGVTSIDLTVAGRASLLTDGHLIALGDRCFRLRAIAVSGDLVTLDGVRELMERRATLTSVSVKLCGESVTEEGLVAVAEGRGPELTVDFEGRVLFTGGQRAGPGVFADRDGLKRAVDSWSSDKARAEVKYGPIGGWDVSRVTGMSKLFCNKRSFNEDISRWNVSEVTNMSLVWCAATCGWRWAMVVV